VVAPVMWALHDFDGKHILRLRGEPFRLDCNLVDTTEDVFYSQWGMVTTNLHYAGALLNPYMLHNKEVANNSDGFNACKIVLQKLCSPKTYPNLMQDVLELRHKQH
jgi:hypothetical protein